MYKAQGAKSKFFFILSAIVFLYSSCRSDDGVSDKKIFRYNQLVPISTLDPAFARNQAIMWGIQHLYDGLVGLDDSLQVIPELAKSWTISEDGLQYTFHLHTNVFFHDDTCFASKSGRKMTASDVVYSFNRIIDSATASSGSWIFKGRVRAEKPFEAENDSTFIIHLVKPFRPMLGILTMQYCSIVPKEAVYFYKKDFRSHPVGTGAFKFKRWIENQGLFLTKNENYWDTDSTGKRLPHLDGVRVYFMPDRKTAYLEMMRHKIDYMVGLESSIINELLTTDGDLQPKQLDKMQLIKTPYLNTEYLGINMAFGDAQTNPLLNKKVRQALNYGFDRELMLKTLRNSVGKPASSGFAPRGLPSFDERVIGYNYNPAKARQLLNEAGYPDGKNLPVIKLQTNKDYLDLCTFITRQWEDLGVKVVVDVLETATLREMMVKGTTGFFRGSWIADYPDAESYYTMFFSGNPAPPNYTRFKNAAFDDLYERAIRENTDSLRYAFYHNLDKILIEEAPVIFLFYDESSRFASLEMQNMSRNSMNLLPLKNVWKK